MPIGGIAALLSGSSVSEFGEAVIFLSQPRCGHRKTLGYMKRSDGINHRPPPTLDSAKSSPTRPRPWDPASLSW